MYIYYMSERFLEQMKIFHCGRSHICTKNFIRQRHQTVQRDVGGQGRIILSLSKVLKKHMPLSDTQVLRIQNL